MKHYEKKAVPQWLPLSTKSDPKSQIPGSRRLEEEEEKEALIALNCVSNIQNEREKRDHKVDGLADWLLTIIFSNGPEPAVSFRTKADSMGSTFSSALLGPLRTDPNQPAPSVISPLGPLFGASRV